MHGRTFSDLNASIWLLSRPVITQLDLKLRETLVVGYNTSEQSNAQVQTKPERMSRMKKDKADMEILEQYFVSRGLFSNQNSRNPNLMNLATGFIAPAQTNVDKAQEVGLKIVEKMYEVDNIKSFSIPKKLLAVQIPPASMMHTSSVEAISIAQKADPQLFLQRLLSVLEDGNFPSLTVDDTLRHYELCSVAPSLFDENGFMRTLKKSDLGKAMIKDNSFISKESGKEIIVDPEVEVICDGGALVNRVKWPRKCKISQVLNNYVTYIDNILEKKASKYNKVTIVFDGYLEKSTKDHTHKQRYPVASMEMVLRVDSDLQCDKDIFLSNPINKQNFIDLLSQHLVSKGMNTIKCKKDADVTIVNCAITKAMNKNAIIIGDDTDLLILAVHYIGELKPPNNVYMFRQSSNTYVDLKSVVSTILEPVRSHILAIHALSGCDTVSQLFGIGKDKLFKQMCKNPSKTNDLLAAFSKLPYDEQAIKDAGFKIIAGLYNMSKAKFEDLRPL